MLGRKVVLRVKEDNSATIKVMRKGFLVALYEEAGAKRSGVLTERRALADCGHPFVVRLAFAFQARERAGGVGRALCHGTTASLCLHGGQPHARGRRQAARSARGRTAAATR